MGSTNQGRGIRWKLVGVGMAALAPLGLVVGAAGPAGASPSSSSPTQRYIVSDLNPGPDQSGSLVSQAGGSLTGAGALGVVNGVTANLTASQASALAAQPGVDVTPDLTVSVSGGATPLPDTDTSTQPAAVFPQDSGAAAVWTQSKDNGSGVNVAVLDTGVDSLKDFSHLLPGVDLSGEGNANQDSYGHGTFVAGLIAGNGAASGGAYTGEAPGAGIIPVKVAGASGQTDMATVIAGINWVIDHQVSDHIGVLNLSLGVQPVESTLLNPLDRAVEKAWDAGIVVVASAGNAGPFNGTILSPGDDPLVITVGALDDMGSLKPSDATMTTFSSVGPTNPDGWFKPDLVAAGDHVVSLRAAGSTIDTANPTARIGTGSDPGNFVGSGTSFSTAIVSGAAALLLADHPGWSPDQVKGALLGSASPGPIGNPFVDGHGQLNVAAANAGHATLDQSAVSGGAPINPKPGWKGTPMGTTVQLHDTWKGSSWSKANWDGSSWSGSQWNGSQWNGSQWNGSQWNGSQWNGSQWNGSSWSGSQWNGSSWSGSSWSGSQWNGSQWNGSSWNGSQWNGSSWSGSQWNGSQWNGSQWNGSQWNGSQWNGSQWN
jgi:serine protease AprX